jgi:hypothetical protein
MTPEQKQQEFHKELKSLLRKFDAELTLEDFGRNWSEDWKIVVNFKFDETLFAENNTGIVPDLVLGTWEDGSELNN